MQPEINQPEGYLAPLKKVTPLSKYLALSLFIILPFLGGWIGYSLAPEKVVKVEKVVVQEASVSPVRTDVQNELSEDMDEQGVLLDNLDVKIDANRQVSMNWNVSDLVLNNFPTETTFVIFKIISVGASYRDNDANGYERRIGSGLNLIKNSFTFDLASREENLWYYKLKSDESYQIVAELRYEPNDFTCAPNPPGVKSCSPVYSKPQMELMNKANEYLYVSEPMKF